MLLGDEYLASKLRTPNYAMYTDGIHFYAHAIYLGQAKIYKVRTSYLSTYMITLTYADPAGPQIFYDREFEPGMIASVLSY